MHAAKISFRYLAALLGIASLWIGCAGASGIKPQDIMRCVRDADCSSGFCDRGSCAYVDGAECHSSTENRAQGDQPCMDGYLCVDHRCRSCTSNAECKAFFGSGACVELVGAHYREGAVCWPKGMNPWDHGNTPGSIETCIHNPDDAPGVKRLAPGLSCARDCDCLSSFCDRGICADRADIGAWNYGKGICHPGPPHAPADNVLTWPTWDMCAGYLCVEGRCRSCTNDAECQDGNPEYRCLPLYGLPGKRCGRPSEAQFGPARDRMGPPPVPRLPSPEGRR